MDFLSCEQCGLVFRHPVEQQTWAARYYDRWYHAARATEIPARDQVTRAKAAAFVGTRWSLWPKIRILSQLLPRGSCVVDWGAAWGYGVYQLQAAGYRAYGFEIAASRAEVGKALLGVEVFANSDTLLQAVGVAGADAIFTNHVVEHLGENLSSTLRAMSVLLRPGGLMFHILPNFSQSNARRTGQWLRWVGRDHPIAPDHRFLCRNLPMYGFEKITVATGPFDDNLAEAVAQSALDRAYRDGDELLVIAYRSG